MVAKDQAEVCHARPVERGSAGEDIGGDTSGPSHPGLAPVPGPAGEMGDLALDDWAG